MTRSLIRLTMADNMKVELCISTLENAFRAFPSIRGAVIHNNRGSQYTSLSYREELNRCGIIQSMNSDGGRYHDNARCEAMWARRKEELLYGRHDTKKWQLRNLKPRYENTLSSIGTIGGFVQSMAICLQCSKENNIMSHWDRQRKSFVKKKCKGILTISKIALRSSFVSW